MGRVTMCLPACRSLLGQFASTGCPSWGGPGIVAGGGGGSPPLPAPLVPVPVHRVVDLTHTLDPDFPTYSGERQFRTRTVASHGTDGWNIRAWSLDEHTGTHVDAPLHRGGGPSVDVIPAEQWVGPLVVIDIRAKAAANADAELTPDDLKAWERRHGRMPEGAIVALHSGWGALARTARFRGADERGTLHFPGFHDEAAAFLLEVRTIKGIVVDTLSLDPGVSTVFPVHTRWLGAGRWGLECAANLEHLPPSGATVVVGAPKVAGGSGGPSRVFALL